MNWETSRDAVPAWHTQVTVYDASSGERIATVFRADAVPLVAAAPDMLEALEAAYLKVPNTQANAALMGAI